MQVKRNSSFELVKVLAVVMIVFSHAMPYEYEVVHPSAVNLSAATTNVQYFLAGMIHNLGQIGNIIFVISSAWFLLESKRASKEKVFQILLDCFVISVFFLAVFLGAGYPLTGSQILRQLLPTTFENNWFISCYLLFSLVHPYLNKILRGGGGGGGVENSLPQREHLRILIFLMVVYAGVQCIIKDSFCYTRIIGFITLYFLTAYVKRYLPHITSRDRAGAILVAVGTLGWFFENFFTNLLGLKIQALSNFVQGWNQVMNPAYIMIALGLVLIAKNHSFYSPPVNYLSGLSLLVYIIHNNWIIYNCVKFDVFQYVMEEYGYKYFLGWVLLNGLALLILGIAGAILYRYTLQKLVIVFRKGLMKKLEKGYRFCEDAILKLN